MLIVFVSRSIGWVGVSILVVIVVEVLMVWIYVVGVIIGSVVNIDVSSYWICSFFVDN